MQKLQGLPTSWEDLPTKTDEARLGGAWLLTGDDINAIWVTLLEALFLQGQKSAPRGQPIIEARGVTIDLINPYRSIIAIPERWLNYSFMVAEWLWMVSGRDDVASVAAYNKQIAKFSDDGLTFFGAYGPRIRAQLPRVLSTLERDPDSRQAVIQIYREPPLGGTKDVPCTLSFQLFIRNEQLEMQVNMRSNDVWLGLPYDIFNFTMIQHGVAAILQREVGGFILHAGSMHLYEQHFTGAREIIENHALSQRYADDDRVVSPLIPKLPGLAPWSPVEQELATRAGLVLPYGEYPVVTREQHAVWSQFLEVMAWKHRHGREAKEAQPLTGFMRHLLERQELRRHG